VAYVGNTPSRGQWRKLTDISASFNGVTTTFTTSVPPGTSQYYVTAGTASQLIISLGGIIQEPDVDYSVSTNSITFTTAPAAGLSFFGVLCGDALNTGVPSDGSITTAKLGGNLTVDLASGSASTPSLTFDSNTGLYSPGEDQVAVATNGVKRIEIQSDGDIDIDGGGVFYDATNNRLAIGTTPNYPLHVFSSTSTVGIRVDGGGDSIVSFANAGSAVGAVGIAAGSITGGGSGNIGIQSGSSLLFATGGISEKARLDSSGRLLVGTNSTSTNASAVFQGYGGTPAGPALLHLCTGTATPTVELGYIIFGNSSQNEGATITAWRDGGTWTSGSSHPSRLVFSTTANGASSTTERFRIRSDGNIGFFNTPGIYPNTDNGASVGFSGNRWSAVYAVTGTIQTSDAREKTEIVNASLGSSFVKALRPVSYKWIEGGKRDTGERDEDGNYIYEPVPGIRTHWGFIAQEVKEAVDATGVDFGGWVLTDKEDPDSQQALRYDQFIAPLTKALQETMAELEALKAEVAALKAA